MEVDFGCVNSQPTGPITDGTCLRQGFVSKSDMLNSVSVLFSTYGRVNEGCVILEITDVVSGKKIAEDRCDVSELMDNDWHDFKLNVFLGENRMCEVRLWTIHCRAGMSFTVHHGAKTEGGYLFVGARLIRNEELRCRFSYAEIGVSGV